MYNFIRGAFRLLKAALNSVLKFFDMVEIVPVGLVRLLLCVGLIVSDEIAIDFTYFQFF